jgi:hypothetical protein
MDTESDVLDGSRGDVSKSLELLRPLWTPDIAPMFWRGVRIGVESGWYGHIPFAHWIVRAVRPRTLVELGTHNGVSYSAFCEAVVRDGLDSRCYAIDTWEGDNHAGIYDETIYRGLRAFHDARYGAFSDLVRCKFDEALPYFPDGSVDLLHIDGFHTYEAVSHDFEAWSAKLSDRAVVLFHDTNVLLGDFGVWRFWGELKERFPTFEFLHAHGLGVLGFGGTIAPQVAALLELADRTAIGAIRERFALLGERWVLEAQTHLMQRELATYIARVADLGAQLAEQQNAKARMEVDVQSAKARMEADVHLAEAAAESVREELERLSEENRQLRDAGDSLRRSTDQIEARAKIAESAAVRARSDGARRAAELGRARAEGADAIERLEVQNHAIKRLEEQIQALQLQHGDAVSHLRAETDQFRVVLEYVLSSKSWRLTEPLRGVYRALRCLRGSKAEINERGLEAFQEGAGVAAYPIVSKDSAVTSPAHANAEAQDKSQSESNYSGVGQQGLSISSVEGEGLPKLSESGQRVWRKMQQMLLAHKKTD